MRFHDLDLNLLVVLDALIAERGVTRAAERLNLTQPALSNSLRRLREHYQDELLVKLGRQMVPTPLAESLRDPVRDALLHIQAIAESRPDFDPSTVTREFTVVASDYVAATLLTEAMRRLAEIAPGISVHILPVSERNMLRLGQGDADLLIIPSDAVVPGHPHRLLFEDRFVCLVWSRNRVLRSPLPLGDYLSARHVLTAIDGDRTLTLDAAHLNELGCERRIAAILPSFTLAPLFVVGTFNIATTLGRLARLFAERLPLKIVEPAIDFPVVSEHLQWHRNRENDPANKWLRDFLGEMAASV